MLFLFQPAREAQPSVLWWPRLREDGLVKARRQGKIMYYSLASNDARLVVDAVSRMFGSRRSALAPPAPIPKSHP